MADGDEWLWGWDPTPGIVSVWAEPSGRAQVWRRLPEARTLVCESDTFRPWLLLATLDHLAHLGSKLAPQGRVDEPGSFRYSELRGPGTLRYRVDAEDGRALGAAVLEGARRSGKNPSRLRELGAGVVLALPPEEQYLVATGRTYFRGMAQGELRRLQLDLETTGLDPSRDRVFLVALCHPNGNTETLEAAGGGDLAEAELLRQLVARVGDIDPDVIENHHLHGFERRELAYEALLSNGQKQWSAGERIRIYRATGGRAALLTELEEDHPSATSTERADPRDYDVTYYRRLLHDTFAARLARALSRTISRSYLPIRNNRPCLKLRLAASGPS